MGKQFLSWMAAGIGAILASALQYFTSGHVLTVSSLLTLVGTALLLRAANWVVATFGPKPAA